MFESVAEYIVSKKFFGTPPIIGQVEMQFPNGYGVSVLALYQDGEHHLELATKLYDGNKVVGMLGEPVKFAWEDQEGPARYIVGVMQKPKFQVWRWRLQQWRRRRNGTYKSVA
jgi:hypothetical protein